MEFKKVSGEGPERTLVDMLDPVMAPGESRTASAPITVRPSGLSCQAELFLGPNDSTKVVTSGLKAFSSTGAAQTVSFPINMPTAAGQAYHVYLDIYAEGFLLVAYMATEDVIIPSGSVGPIDWD